MKEYTNFTIDELLHYSGGNGESLCEAWVKVKSRGTKELLVVAVEIIDQGENSIRAIGDEFIAYTHQVTKIDSTIH